MPHFLFWGSDFGNVTEKEILKHRKLKAKMRKFYAAPNKMVFISRHYQFPGR